MEIGSYPFFQANGGTGVRIVLRRPDMARIDEIAEEVITLIHELGEQVVEVI